MTATVRPIRATVYDEAMRGALSAGLNWPVKLRHAQVLSSSDNPTHRTLAEHVRTSASLHEAGLLVAVPPPKRDLLPRLAPPVENPRRGVIRAELMGIAGLAVVCAVAWVMLRMGGV